MGSIGDAGRGVSRSSARGLWRGQRRGHARRLPRSGGGDGRSGRPRSGIDVSRAEHAAQALAACSVPGELAEDRRTYQRALEAAQRALAKAAPAGRPYVEYWVGRLEFGIGYLDTIEELHRAARAESDKNPAEASRLAASALAAFRRALEAYARVARDQSDRGTLAALAEFAYRPLRDKVAAMNKSAVGADQIRRETEAPGR